MRYFSQKLLTLTLGYGIIISQTGNSSENIRKSSPNVNIFSVERGESNGSRDTSVKRVPQRLADSVLTRKFKCSAV